MKVVHVHRLGSIGGSERHLLTLLPALAARGLDVAFVGLDLPGEAPAPFYAELERLGIPFARAPSTRDLSPRTAARLRRFVERTRPDVLHTHLVHADAYGALVGGERRSSRRSTTTIRSGPGPSATSSAL